MLKLVVPAVDQALAWLAPRLGAGTAQRLRLAYGAPLRALEEFDQGTLEQRETLIRGFIGIGRGEVDPVATAVAWNGIGTRLSLDCLVDCLSDLLRLSVTAAPPRLAVPELAVTLAGFAGHLAPGAVHRLLGRVFEAKRSLESNLNSHMQLESLLIEWARIGPR
jgi:DNA polymerase-3 subunit delta'